MSILKAQRILHKDPWYRVTCAIAHGSQLAEPHTSAEVPSRPVPHAVLSDVPYVTKIPAGYVDLKMRFGYFTQQETLDVVAYGPKDGAGFYALAARGEFVRDVPKVVGPGEVLYWLRAPLNRLAISEAYLKLLPYVSLSYTSRHVEVSIHYKCPSIVGLFPQSEIIGFSTKYLKVLEGDGIYREISDADLHQVPNTDGPISISICDKKSYILVSALMDPATLQRVTASKPVFILRDGRIASLPETRHIWVNVSDLPKEMYYCIPLQNVNWVVLNSLPQYKISLISGSILCIPKTLFDVYLKETTAAIISAADGQNKTVLVDNAILDAEFLPCFKISSHLFVLHQGYLIPANTFPIVDIMTLQDYGTGLNRFLQRSTQHNHAVLLETARVCSDNKLSSKFLVIHRTVALAAYLQQALERISAILSIGVHTQQTHSLLSDKKSAVQQKQEAFLTNILDVVYNLPPCEFQKYVDFLTKYAGKFTLQFTIHYPFTRILPPENTILPLVKECDTAIKRVPYTAEYLYPKTVDFTELLSHPKFLQHVLEYHVDISKKGSPASLILFILSLDNAQRQGLIELLTRLNKSLAMHEILEIINVNQRE